MLRRGGLVWLYLPVELQSTSGEGVGVAVGGEVDGAVGGEVGGAVRGEVGGAVGGEVGRAVGEAVDGVGAVQSVTLLLL